MAILVMAANPARSRRVLVTPFRHEIEIVVGSVDDVDATGIRGVRMEDARVAAVIEHAQPFALRIAGRKCVVVVDNLVGLLGLNETP